jgi:hypothetical protein
MKKIFFILISFASFTSLIAQEPADALRFAWTNASGTARQQAIGGAIASLGGDITSTFVNPAGLGFYKTGDFVITPGFKFQNNKSTYFGHTEKDKKNSFSYGTTGLVLGGALDNRNKIKGAALCLAINQTANFNSNILYRGVNNQNSYSYKFLEEIRNNNDKDANHVASGYIFGTSLAFNTYWIDTVAGGSSNNFQFKSRAPVATGLIQQNNIESSGGITEFALAGAVNVQEKLMAGATIAIPFLRYNRAATFQEVDSTKNNTNYFDFASITENLTTNGSGINIKLGLIYKPVDYLRLGFAFHSPTIYTLTDTYNASVTANTESYKGSLIQKSEDFNNGADGRFRYSHITPYKFIASASYVLRETEDVKKQKGFLTADVEYVNYKASRYETDPEGDNSQSTKDYLKKLNTAIDNSYKGAINVKAGGELKFTTLMVRLGGAYYGNPYQDLGRGEKGSRFQLTAGLGYRNKGMFVDVAYVHTMGKDFHYPYRLQYGPFSGASIKSTGGNAVLTFGVKI